MAKAKGISGLVSKASKTSGGNGRTQTAVVNLPKNLREFVSDWHEGKEEEQRGMTQRKSAEGDLSPWADEALVRECQNQGKLVTSIRLSAGDLGSVLFVRQNRWCKMPVEHEDELRHIFGNEFDSFFKVKTALSIDVDSLTDDEASAIEKALGANRCSEVLKAEQVIELAPPLWRNAGQTASCEISRNLP